MKLLGIIVNDKFYFSCSRHDCNGEDGAICDGGQPGCTGYAGYTRFSIPALYAELPNVNFADIFNDYHERIFSKHKRKYGCHKLSDITILPVSEYPNTDSIEWQIENTVWGTNGINGDKPTRYIHLKDAATSHLQAILDNVPHASNQTKEIIINILIKRLKGKEGV